MILPRRYPSDSKMYAPLRVPTSTRTFAHPLLFCEWFSRR
jgi:hypothetical protein